MTDRTQTDRPKPDQDTNQPPPDTGTVPHPNPDTGEDGDTGEAEDGDARMGRRYHSVMAYS
ncbi:MAG: hypothetical protein H0U69_03565 [Trueperaceae bacterium]|nr:hypothetical protein [Trueperaceae bacterium]